MNTVTQKIAPFHLSSAAREWLSFSICLVCLALFVISAYDKITEHDRFLRGLVKVKYISDYALFVSWAVPITETVIAVMLLFPASQKPGLYGFTLLMSVFTIYIGSMWLWAEKLPCHCNLIVEKLSWGQHVWFNIAFIAIASYALILQKNGFKHKH
ncbi:MauE/DoxX family redox-associated membrane protein [Pedobacter panaciterrae]|uniref:MauE/DoxX family redox-associated membrane protein n=1 Tax=Pedobacter panaciterrae TaxID=363849 RepID=A0ABU8NJ31_9SPHI